MDVKERGCKYYNEQGLTCSEATWMCLNEQDLSKEELDFGMKIAGSFSGGMACGATCGVVAGVVMTFGRWFGRSFGEERTTKAFCKWFNEHYSSMDCCDLKLQNSKEAKAFCTEMLCASVAYAEKLLDEGLEGEECQL